MEVVPPPLCSPGCAQEGGHLTFIGLSPTPFFAGGRRKTLGGPDVSSDGTTSPLSVPRLHLAVPQLMVPPALVSARSTPPVPGCLGAGLPQTLFLWPPPFF